MGRPMIGELLGQMGKLSAMDIDEILAEQASSRRHFGQIALSWGLCEPQDVCDAFCAQLANEDYDVDLASFGIDERATRCVPAQMARRMHVVPLRNIGDQLVVAASHRVDSVEMAELLRATGRDVRLIQADPEQIEKALDEYYPPAAA